MAEQKELFDGFLRLRKCRKCQRKLHVDPNDNYKTRLAGLCYACVNSKSRHTGTLIVSLVSPMQLKNSWKRLNNLRACSQHRLNQCESKNGWFIVWFLIENVPCVPDVRIEGYSVQRIPITDLECGGMQLRSRHVQFGSRKGDIIRPIRVNDLTRNRKKGRKTLSVTTKTDRWTDFPDLCRRQGLDEPIELPGWFRTAKFKAVGNGVPLRMGKTLAEAVVWRAQRDPETDCQCDCGRSVSKRAFTATASCRKRKQLSSEPRPWVDIEGYHYA